MSLPLVMLAVGCLEEPCEQYVDYMCQCHPDEADCADLRTQLEGADQDVQDACAVDLDTQQDEDEDNGEECTVV